MDGVICRHCGSSDHAEKIDLYMDGRIKSFYCGRCHTPHRFSEDGKTVSTIGTPSQPVLLHFVWVNFIVFGLLGFMLTRNNPTPFVLLAIGTAAIFAWARAKDRYEAHVRYAKRDDDD